VGVELRARPFAIHIEDAVLADLRMRLNSARWPIRYKTPDGNRERSARRFDR
jgi:hypothetical protein